MDDIIANEWLSTKAGNVEITPNESLITRYVCEETEHDDTDNLSDFFDRHRAQLSAYTDRFAWEYSLKWLTEIFNPYRFKATSRLYSLVQVFGRYEEDAILALLNLNVMGMNSKIENFILPKSHCLGYKVGISKNVGRRLTEHNRSYSVLQSAAILTNVTCSEMHLVELCGVLKLRELAGTQQIGKCLNESLGYDNGLILSASGNCSVYILACLESFVKTSKATGKLSWRSNEAEVRIASQWYDLYTSKNHVIFLREITKQMQKRHRKNPQCSVFGCEEAFVTELSVQVHVLENHILDKVTCRKCGFTGSLSSVEHHINQKRECQGKSAKKVTQCKTKLDRYNNMEIDFWRLKNLMDCDGLDFEKYKTLREKRQYEYENETNSGSGLDDLFVKEKQAKHTEGHYILRTGKRDARTLNVLMHFNDFERDIVWYHPNPWILFLMRRVEDNVYRMTGDFCSTADIKVWNDMMNVSAEVDLRYVSDEKVSFELPLSKKNCKFVRVYKPSTAIVPPKPDEGFPTYLICGENILSMRSRYPCGKYGPVN